MSAPTPVRSFGPNGTHWPDRTPWLYDTPPTVVDVDCTWPAIKAAINTITAAQAAAGIRVNVRPGTLPGNGGSASSTPVLSGAGGKAWTQRVLVTPRDGRGTVKFSGDIRIHQTYNVCFAGFDLRPKTVTFSGCTGSAFAWSTCSAWRVIGVGGTIPGTSTSSGQITEGFDLVEVVIPDVQVGDLDPAGFGSGYPGPAGPANGNGWLRNCKMVGCYVAPQYLAPGGIGHNDGTQLYGSSVYYGFLFQDTAIFSCNNSAIQAGGWAAGFDALVGPIDHFLTLDHCLLVNAEKGTATRYPLPPSAKALTGAGSAINGAGRSGSLFAKDSITIGSLYTTNWADVQNSFCTVIPRPSAKGAWVRDDSYARWTNADFDRYSPIPTDDYLAQVWGVQADQLTLDLIDALDADWADLALRLDQRSGVNRTQQTAAWAEFRSTLEGIE